MTNKTKTRRKGRRWWWQKCK